MNRRYIEREQFKPYFDVRGHSDMVIARVFQEERVTSDIASRVVHAERYYKSRIERDSWDFNKHSEAERQATVNAFGLARDGYNLVFWVSPRSDVYEEGRFNIMLSGTDENGTFFDPWGMPLLANEVESLELGKNLLEQGGISMDPIYDVESLRVQPIGFEIGDSERWLDECERLMPELAQIWKTIRSGNVDENMKRIALVVKEAKETAKGDNVYFERLMKQSGFELNVSGSHGGSWLSMEIGGKTGVIIVATADGISYRVGSTEGLTLCSKCGCWHSGEKCPLCG